MPDAQTPSPQTPAARLFALLPCAGTGSRAGTAGPKQYEPLLGVPLVLHTLSAFHAVDRIDRVLVVVSPGDRFQITIHLERPYADGDPNEIIATAIHNYFSYKTDLVRAEVKRLLTEGRVSLLIGLVFLTVCLIGAESIGTATSGTTSRVLREGLTIIGWVALWRPLQIFLYDWWPLARRRRIYRNLARALVKVVERPGE